MPTFITDNYLWFLIGALVIVMAIIGYYADKTDFGRNKPEKLPKEKKVKEKKKKETEEPLMEEPMEEPSFEPTKEVPVKEEKKKKRRKKEKKPKEKKGEEIKEVPVEENLLDTFTLPEEVHEEPVMESQPMVEEPEAPVDPLLTPPAGALDEPVLTPVDQKEDLFVGLDGTPDAFKQEDPSVDELNEKMVPLEEVSQTDQNDDVWKF